MTKLIKTKVGIFKGEMPNVMINPQFEKIEEANAKVIENFATEEFIVKNIKEIVVKTSKGIL